MPRRLCCCAVVILVFALAAPLTAQDRHSLTRGLQRRDVVAPMTAVTHGNLPIVPGARCLPVRRELRNATVVAVLFALPVAAIAGKLSDDSWRAARWAGYTGTAYSFGGTAVRMNRTRCTSTDALLYMWTPLAAAAGATAATLR